MLSVNVLIIIGKTNGYKKWVLLLSILFIDSGTNNNVNMVNKVNLILAVCSLQGKVKKAAVNVTSEKEGTENEKLFS